MSEVIYLTATNTDAGEHNNEDSFLIRNYKSHFLVLVSDGVGGLESGEIASGFIKRSFDKWFDRNIQRFNDMSIDEIKNNIHNEIIKIHENLLDIAEDKGDNFGATLTLLFVKRWDYIVAEIGDSRLYMAEDDKVKQITRDQTVSEYEKATGKIITGLPEERKEHTLMQCMGQRKVLPEFTTGTLPLEYTFLACSDGLSNTISLEEFESYINKKDLKPRNKLKELTALARERGETDNITSVYLQRKKVDRDA